MNLYTNHTAHRFMAPLHTRADSDSYRKRGYKYRVSINDQFNQANAVLWIIISMESNMGIGEDTDQPNFSVSQIDDYRYIQETLVTISEGECEPHLDTQQGSSSQARNPDTKKDGQQTSQLQQPSTDENSVTASNFSTAPSMVRRSASMLHIYHDEDLIDSLDLIVGLACIGYLLFVFYKMIFYSSKP